MRKLSPLGVLLLFILGCAKDEPVQSPSLLCYVGGTMRPAMEELAKLYESETGRRVELDYSDSGELLIKIEATGKGDLYVCHDPFVNALMRKGLGVQSWTVANLKPMIAVPKGNPKNIRSLKDLARGGIKIGLTDEMYSTVGHINQLMFDKAGIRSGIEKNVITRTRMGGQIANAVMLGHVDAAIVWNAVIYARKNKLDEIDIESQYRPQPKVDAVTTATFGLIDMSAIRVTIATLKCSRLPEAAKAFAELVSSARGRAVFAKRGFSPAQKQIVKADDFKIEADDSETLYLYCGAGIRPAVAEIVQAFTTETGVKVQCDYAGSGVLISRLRLIKRGDLYMPGDMHYIELAEKEGLIASKETACYFVPVILVKKGNPKNIQGLTDLVRPGVKLGLGNAETCAIGRKANEIFDKNGISEEAVKKNVLYSSFTVNELGVQIKAGKLDAVIVWDATAAYYADSADTVEIPPEQNIISHVGIGVLKFSKRQQLASRFVSFVTGQRGKAIFEKNSYTTSLPE